MKRFLVIFLIILFVMPFATVTSQTVKIASIAPEGTPWGQGLNKLAADWHRITNGRVRLQVFHGGIAGDEVDIVRKMRLGQIQAAALTTNGSSEIVRELIGFSLPGVISTTEELDYVLESREDEFQEIFRENGFELLTWSNAGWIKLFTTKPVNNPEQLRGLKMAAGDADELILNAFRNLGIQPIGVSSPEILSGLNSGLINAVVYAPIGVAGFQWFAIVNNLLDVNIAPFFGTLVIDNRTWRRIPQQYHDELKESAREVGLQIQRDLQQLENEAVELMTEYGLNVTRPGTAQTQRFTDAFENQVNILSGEYLDNDLMDIVFEAIEEFRR